MHSKVVYNELMESNKNNTQTFLSVRLSIDLRDRLKQQAKKNKRSMHAQVLWVLEQYVVQEEQQEEQKGKS